MEEGCLGVSGKRPTLGFGSGAQVVISGSVGLVLRAELLVSLPLSLSLSRLMRALSLPQINKQISKNQS